MESMRRQAEHAIIFDLDGVLVDSRSAIAGCINHALGRHGLPQHAESRLHRFIGPRLATAFAELTVQPADSTLVAACVDTFRERYAEASLRDTTVPPGVAAALAELTKDHRLAVAISNPPAFAEPLLDALALRDFFAVVVGPGLSAHGQDKSATVGLALDLVGNGPAVMVGDRSFDVIGAHANGLPAIGVTWGIGSVEEIAAAGADAIVDAPAELAAAVTTLLRGSHHATVSRG